MDNAKYIISFIFGAIAGAVIAFAISEKAIKKIKETEEEEVISAKSTKATPTDYSVADKLIDKEKMKNKYEELASKYIAPLHEKSDKHPYVITPDEMDENNEYEHLDMTLYSDGILVIDNQQMDPIEDIDSFVGSGNLDHIGEYVTDTVYIQDDKNKRYLEITEVTEKYYDEE